MRTLTKSGIRKLTVKYRSILKKCVILNALVLILGAGSAFAEDYIEKSQVRNKPYSVVSLAGAAIYNSPSSAMSNIDANFISNFLSAGSEMENSSAYGGAIYNSYEMQNINGNFTGNYSTTFNTYGYSVANGGAIYNMRDITSIHGDFNTNYVSASASMQLPTAYGGAIYNTANIGSITGNFVGNYALASSTQFFRAIAYGGAIYNTGAVNILAEGNKNLKFDGNYVIGKKVAQGGAIYSTGTVGLYAKTINDSITFTGESAISGAQDVDGVYNEGTLNINGFTDEITKEITAYNGTVQLYNVVNNKGIVNIYGGTVSANSFSMSNQSTLNLQNNAIDTVNLGTVTLSGKNYLKVDAKLDTKEMDKIDVTTLNWGDGTLDISDIRLLSDATKDEVSLSLFTDGTDTSIYEKVTGNLSGLKYSSLYTYDANYDDTVGQITFTRHSSGSSDDYNPYLYTPSTVAQTIANITGQIAGLALDKLDVAVADSEKGLSGGDMPKANNAWVKVMGFDDDVDFKHFNSIDSKAYTLAGGFNTDKVQFADVDAGFGIYGGYIGGRQKYTGNKIDQKGGYIGLSSELKKGNAFLLSTVNSGFINNEAENMYGTDKFDTCWFGIGVKGGYNYVLTDTWTLQPNLYAGYTLVNTEDYTSKSGVIINNDNLNFFEIDPGFKLSTQIDKNWSGFIQGKYVIVMDNGGETIANKSILPNLSTKNYFEYGFGINKFLTDFWSLNIEINRRDGGRNGWNGSLEFKYNF